MGTPGQLVVNRYRLGRALGQGSMGVVWEGQDTLLNRPIAIKEVLFPPGLRAQQEAELGHRISRAARTAQRVVHRNLVAVYDVAEEDGRPWIVMEPVHSRALDRVIATDGVLSVDKAVSIASPVLAALTAVHAAGLVHGDVKPANILIGYDGRVVLSDFGMASFDGSPEYRAPEGRRTAAADLWSLGATLYTMVTGRPPENVPDLAEVPESLRPVVRGLLTKDPAKRIDADEAERLLDDLSGPIGGEIVSVTPTGGGRGRLIAGVVAAAVLVGAVGGWALLRDGDGASLAAAASPSPSASPSPVVAPTFTSTVTASPIASPTSSPTSTRLRLRWYRPGTGWAAAHPRGWRLEVQENLQEWISPDGQARFGVEVIDWGEPDPLALLQETEAAVKDSAKAYRKIRLERIKDADPQIAEWEGRWKGVGTELRPWAEPDVIYHEVRRVIFTGYTTTILSWVAADQEWERLKPTMDAVFRRYQVPEGDLITPPSRSAAPEPTP